ncbi:hypothetical protein ACHAXS_011851, partial [Conticribra weissflogii]
NFRGDKVVSISTAPLRNWGWSVTYIGEVRRRIIVFVVTIISGMAADRDSADIQSHATTAADGRVVPFQDRSVSPTGN